MSKKIETWSLWEENMVHTSGLDKATAQEMLERYSSTYPDILFFIAPTTSNEPHH
jgi:hypothetical protein